VVSLPHYSIQTCNPPSTTPLITPFTFKVAIIDSTRALFYFLRSNLQFAVSFSTNVFSFAAPQSALGECACKHFYQLRVG
jgi:hypothetical protein